MKCNLSRSASDGHCSLQITPIYLLLLRLSREERGRPPLRSRRKSILAERFRPNRSRGFDRWNQASQRRKAPLDGQTSQNGSLNILNEDKSVRTTNQRCVFSHFDGLFDGRRAWNVSDNLHSVFPRSIPTDYPHIKKTRYGQSLVEMQSHLKTC